MNNLDKYIKMCDKASEIQNIQHWPKWFGNNGHEPNTFIPTWETYSKIWYLNLAQYQDIPTSNKLIWLPRQDQLQEMTEIIDIFDLLDDFSNWLHQNIKYLIPYTKIEMPWETMYSSYYRFTSIEQIWLAFLMMKKYNKIWEDTKWVSKPATEINT